MIAFKGFTKDLKSVMGDGKKETCVFQPGETKRVERSKTANSGFHCCEYPPACLGYYRYGESRFFRVEASGDIDEDDAERIAATEITLVEELDAKSFAKYTMLYMLNYPRRQAWESHKTGVMVAKDKAEAKAAGHIAIARGENPCVKGAEGSIVGLLVDSGGEILNAKMLVITSKYAEKWIRINENREVEVLEDEGKGD